MPTAPPGCEAQLVERYGLLMTLTDVAEALRYPSTQAARKARLRGALPVQLVQIPNRRGWWAMTRAVAQFLDSLEATAKEGPS